MNKSVRIDREIIAQSLEEVAEATDLEVFMLCTEDDPSPVAINLMNKAAELREWANALRNAGSLGFGVNNCIEVHYF